MTKKTLKYMHGVIHLVAFIASVVALKGAFSSHNELGYQNLYSLHSWIGLVTVIIFAAQVSNNRRYLYISKTYTFTLPGLIYFPQNIGTSAS